MAASGPDPHAGRAAGAPADLPGEIPVGGTTGICHETTAAIDEAAAWLATSSRAERQRPVVPLLRERFGLTVLEACMAIREAAMMKARAT